MHVSSVALNNLNITYKTAPVINMPISHILVSFFNTKSITVIMRDRNDAPVNKYVFQLISGDLLNIIATIANDKYTIIKSIMGKTTLLALFNCSFVTVPPLFTC